MIKSYIVYFLECFGFTNLTDLGDSLLHYNTSILTLVRAGAILGVLTTLIKDFIGIEPIVYLAFICLIIMEFITGVGASVKEGDKIESRKFGRMILKVAAYSATLGLLNIFKVHLTVPTVFNMSIDIYGWLFFMVMDMVIIQLFISVLENLGRLGYMETSLILRLVKKQLNKWFDLD